MMVSASPCAIRPDAGHGARLYVNGQLTKTKNHDIWWNYDWNSGSVFSQAHTATITGGGQVDLFFAEGCCMGGFGYQIRSRSNSGQQWSSWQNLRPTMLDDAPYAL